MLAEGGGCLLLVIGALMASRRPKSPAHRRALVVFALASLYMSFELTLHSLGCIPKPLFVPMSLPAWALLVWCGILWRRAERPRAPSA